MTSKVKMRMFEGFTEYQEWLEETEEDGVVEIFSSMEFSHLLVVTYLLR